MKRPYSESLHKHLPNFVNAASSADWQRMVGDYRLVRENLVLALNLTEDLISWIDKNSLDKGSDE